ncbi:hypothetical protein AVEN_266168-1 [Araneus ventricosus]|uniref:Uncharacterized protein n=1 Tax=Araneus ventricosus TaxID=182803 RepID=A0A4Y2VPX6_ARAVE|nr:hypothetical protein AVEN_266168-1 [Araneus ventricosus]
MASPSPSSCAIKPQPTNQPSPSSCAIKPQPTNPLQALAPLNPNQPSPSFCTTLAEGRLIHAIFSVRQIPDSDLRWNWVSAWSHPDPQPGPYHSATAALNVILLYRLYTGLA